MWKKLFYPLATLVMMALALPFAYMQARAGMVGVKVFLGIMLGIFFHMLNSLFSHIGLLQNWPPLRRRRSALRRLPLRGCRHDVVGRAPLTPLNRDRPHFSHLEVNAQRRTSLCAACHVLRARCLPDTPCMWSSAASIAVLASQRAAITRPTFGS